MLLQNKALKNSTVEIEGVLYTFDEDGVADVQPDELAEKLVTINTNYTIKAVSNEDDESREVAKKVAVLDVDVDTDANGGITVDVEEEELQRAIEESGISEVSESMTHDALDAIANSMIEEGRLDADLYKKAKTKKEKVTTINTTK